jgi:hypothetical protein
MKYTCLTIFIISIFNSCGVQQTFPHSDDEYYGDYYFPIATQLEENNTNDKLDTFENKWYSKHLNSLIEPILSNLNDSVQIYRYTNLGTWDSPFSYRIEKKDTVINVIFKQTNGQGGYDVGKLTINETKSTIVKYWDSLEMKITKFNFWETSTHIQDGGKDGSIWILEGYKNGKYHFITRWSPDYYGDSNFVATCNYFEELFKN